MEFSILFRRSDTEKGRLIYEHNKKTAAAFGIRWDEYYEKDAATPDAIKDALKNADALLWIDENGALNPGVKRPAEECVELVGEGAALFCVDVGSEKERWNPRKLSAAQGIFRNKPEAFAFLRDWGAAYEKRKTENNDRLALQRALNDVAKDSVEREEEYYIFAGTYGRIVAQTYHYSAAAARLTLAAFERVYGGDQDEKRAAKKNSKKSKKNDSDDEGEENAGAC